MMIEIIARAIKQSELDTCMWDIFVCHQLAAEIHAALLKAITWAGEPLNTLSKEMLIDIIVDQQMKLLETNSAKAE